jgi:hypothetical protein
VNTYRNKLGYRTYVQFMMDLGRNGKPDGATYTPLSASSADCPYHQESTAGGTFSFPPSEQPTHAIRRALIAGIEEVKRHNETIPDMNQRDWVSIVSFDTTAGAVLRQSLTGDYNLAMAACTGLQADSDSVANTSTETGLLLARQHIDRPENGGQGRRHAEKVVVLLTDGIPNLKTSSDATVSSYRSSHPSADFYGGSGGNYYYDAALMQTMTMELQRWRVFPVGVGLGCDYDFMDRLARMGSTADQSGESHRTSGSPVAYEQEVYEIFNDIISNPRIRLVR